LVEWAYHAAEWGRIFAKRLRANALPKRRKDCKMPSKPAFRLSMIRKSMPSGYDPMGGYRFSEKDHAQTMT
jgi:hypothetical protein